VSGSGREEIDAKGHLVAPGWVDIHPITMARQPGISVCAPRRASA
jgi:predicted amidohydrolase